MKTPRQLWALVLRGLLVMGVAVALTACGDEEAAPTAVDDEESPEAHNPAPDGGNDAAQLFRIDT